MAFAILPTLVYMTYLIPDSVEASMSILIFFFLNFSYDLFGKLQALAMFKIFNVSEDDLTNLYKAAEFKMYFTIFYMCFIPYLPSKDDLREAIGKQNGMFITKNINRGDREIQIDFIDDEVNGPRSTQGSSRFSSAMSVASSQKGPVTPTFLHGKTGYKMNPKYEGMKTNSKVKDLMDFLDESN